MNWDVIKKIAIAIPTGAVVITNLLSAVGLSTVQVGQVMAALLAGGALLVWGIDTVRSALAQTDAGKAQTFERLDEQGKAAVLDNTSMVTKASIVAKLPDELKLQAVNDIPEVTKVVTVNNPTNGVAKAVASPDAPKIVTETEEKAA